MLLLNAEEVRKSLPMKEATEAMKGAYAALSSEKAVVPLRTRLPIPGSEALSLFMPAYVYSADGQALAIKVVSLFPDNPARGLAYIQAAVLVFDPQTGRAIALLEGSSLTAIRTGAASGLATELLARRDATRVAASNPDLWLDICAENRPAIVAALDGLLDRLRGEARAGRDTGQLVRAIAQVMDTRELAQGNVNPQLLAAVLAEDLGSA